MNYKERLNKILSEEEKPDDIFPSEMLKAAKDSQYEPFHSIQKIKYDNPLDDMDDEFKKELSPFLKIYHKIPKRGKYELWMYFFKNSHINEFSLGFMGFFTSPFQEMKRVLGGDNFDDWMKFFGWLEISPEKFIAKYDNTAFGRWFRKQFPDETHKYYLIAKRQDLL